MADVIGGADLEIGVDATGAVADVEKSLQAIIKSGTKAGKEAAAAIEKGLSGPIKVEAAKAVEAATKNLAGAEDDLARSIENRAIAAKGVEANERALAEVREQAGEASSKFAKAEQALMKSQQGLRNATDQVSSAQVKALTASRTLTEAMKKAADAMDAGDDAAGGLGKALEGLRTGLSRAASSASSFAKDLASKIVSGGKAALTKAGQLLGTSLTTGLKATTKVAGTAIAGMLTNALTRGFARLKAIDDAKSKLEGLRYSGKQIDGVMKSALESVKGTAFGLGDAAGTAATLLAAGVAEGDALTRSLKVVADTATIAGADLGEMSLVFGKAAASNKVSGEIVQQLLGRQIPILGMLSKALGKTQGDVQKMVSAGEVSFEMLQKAIEDSIGGAALAGDSFSSGLANLNAAFGRFGATLLDSAFQGMKGIFANAIPAVDALTDAVKPLVEQLSNRLGPAISDLSERGFKRIAEMDFSKVTSSLSNLQGAAGPLIGLMLGALGGLLSGLPVVGGLFAGITGPVGLVLGLIVQMFTKSEALRDAVSGVFDSLTSAGGSLTPILKTLADLVGVFAKGLGDTLAEAINVVVPILSDLAEAILPVISDLFTDLAPVITDVVGALGDGLLTVISEVAPVLGDLALSLLPALSRILGVISPLLEAIAPLFQPLADLLVAVLVPALEFLTPILTALADLLATFVEWLGGAITGLIEGLASFASGLDSGLVQPMSGAWAGIKMAVQPVVDWFKTYVAPLFEAVGGAISAVFSRLASHFKVVLAVFRVVGAGLEAVWGTFWSVFKATWSSLGQPILAALNTAWEVMKTVAVGAWNHIKTVIETVLGVLTGIIKAATAVFKGDWSGALDAMKNVATTIWNGITGLFDNAIGTIKGVLGTLKDSILSTFSNAGSWLSDAGKKILTGFIDGIKSGFNKVKETLGNLTSMLPSWKGPAKRDAKILKPAGKLLMQGLVAGITEDRDKVKGALGKLTKDLVKFQEDAIKAEAKRLVQVRKKANDAIRKANAQRPKWARAKALMPTLSMDEATKIAKKNLSTASAAMKAAQKKVSAQDKTTARLWNRGTYQSSKVERWRGLSLGTTTLLNGLKANGKFTKTASALVRKATLADIGRAREDVKEALASAKDTLADMRVAREDLAASVRDNIVGELDLTAGLAKDTVNEFGYTVKGKTTFAAVAGTVKSLAAKAKTFATKLKDLARRGIPAGLIQEVAGYGTEQGTEVANALLSGTSQQVKDLSKDYASLTSWSGNAGNTVAGSMYDVGIAAQQGLINGLNSDNKKLEAAAQQLSNRVVKAVKKSLGIKSPSVVFRDEVGKMLGQGIDVGMNDYAPNLQGTVKSLMAPLKNGPISGAAVPANAEEKGQYVTATEVLTLLRAIRLDVRVGADQQTKAQWVLDGMSAASRTDGTTLSGILDDLRK